MRNLGDAILNANPTSEDRAEGERWLEMAIAKGDVNAMWYFGLRTAEPRRSAEWYLRAAQAGHQYAMISYAESLLAGRGVATDEAAAMRWLEHAARLGNSDVGSGAVSGTHRFSILCYCGEDRALLKN